MTERIHKVIAAAGFSSRRHAEDLVAQGRVTVDGTVATIGQRIDAEAARVEIDGVLLPVNPDLVYVLLNKPRGVVSTADDPQGRPTVVDMAAVPARVYPVGRLDADSEGLLLLTNDGELTNRLTHPRFGVGKTYTALVTGAMPDTTLRLLERGVDLDDGLAAARNTRLLDRRPDRTLVEIVMGEGRNREVRRMCSAVGFPVERLVRTAIGPLRDHSLRQGSARRLTLNEVRTLYAASGKLWQDHSPVEQEPGE